MKGKLFLIRSRETDLGGLSIERINIALYIFIEIFVIGVGNELEQVFI